MKVWSHMFSLAYGPKAVLRPLVIIPRFKSSYMMFMCASSLHVCEKCFGLTKFNACNLSNLPLPIPVLLPRRSADTVKYVGDRFDPEWTIRMCLSCRQYHISFLEEPVPRGVCNGLVTWRYLCSKYPCANHVPGLSPPRKQHDLLTVLTMIRCLQLHATTLWWRYRHGVFQDLHRRT